MAVHSVRRFRLIIYKYLNIYSIQASNRLQENIIFLLQIYNKKSQNARKFLCCTTYRPYVIQHVFYHYLRLATLYGTERPVTALGRYSLRGRYAFRNANITLVCIPRLSIPIISHAIWYITLATHSKRPVTTCGRYSLRGYCAFRNANIALVCIPRIFFVGGDAHNPTVFSFSIDIHQTLTEHPIVIPQQAIHIPMLSLRYP